MGPIGVQEMMGIFLVALLLFGPKKLPELGRMLGKGLREFKRMKNEVKTTFETHLQELEREARLAEFNQPKTLASAPDYSSDRYGYPYEPSVPQTPTYETTAVTGSPAASPVASNGVPHELPHASVVPGTVARNGAVPVEEEHPA